MHQDDADYITDMTAALNAICNAIREHDRGFAEITAAVLRRQKETLTSDKGRDMFRNLIDVLEFDNSARLQ
ncbi:hypothetical protein R5W60_16870 [Brucella pseudintermedia]|uniref:hypothetical protein n=1 Tax=Brucella pseudintermedia TaxID=370111 RepID=UPI0005A2284F|nr:hypothetical protein R5W60_16870 [Brucella pseudintermedia]SUA60303.1 Uncharacterised protein [Brucella anthropi]